MKFDLKNKPVIQDLLYEIEMEITAISKLRRQNDKYDLDYDVDLDTLDKLVIYKRVLNRMLWNSNYANCGSRLHDIYSTVKPLISVNTTEICVFNRTSTTTSTTTTNP